MVNARDTAALRLMLDVNPEDGARRMYACRGVGKGCKRNLLRDPKSQKICADCVLARDEETIGELQERLARLN